MALIGSRTTVMVGHQQFSIPSDKISQVLSLLTRLESIQVVENVPPPVLAYNGVSLINE